MRFRHHLCASAVLIAGACAGSSATEPTPVGHDAEGSWTRGGGLSPGNSFVVTLHESGGIIVGTGTFSDEAGPQGSLAVNGTVANDSLRLQIVFIADPALLPLLEPDTSQFVGTLTTRNRIDGTLTTRGSVATTLSLIRLPLFLALRSRSSWTGPKARGDSPPIDTRIRCSANCAETSRGIRPSLSSSAPSPLRRDRARTALYRGPRMRRERSVAAT